MQPPKFLFLQTNQRCNLRCNHCFYWKLNDDDKREYFPVESRQWLVEEFAKLGGQTIVTCGGEPTLDFPDWMNLAELSHKNGLKMFSVTNGTKIQTRERAEEIIAAGPDEISVSLDSCIESDHDVIRGVNGSFAMAVNALELLLVARKKLGGNTRIYAMTIVTGYNYILLPSFFHLVLNQIGADKLKLNIMQPSFQQPAGEVDHFFADNQCEDPEDLARVLNRCNEEYSLNLNPTWIAQVVQYVTDIKSRKPELGWWSSSTYGTSEHICNTYERNIIINMQGIARLCFADAFAGLKMTAPGDLTRFWTEFAAPIREQMKSCNRYCGISHSVRKESATLRNVDKRLPVVANSGP